MLCVRFMLRVMSGEDGSFREGVSVRWVDVRQGGSRPTFDDYRSIVWLMSAQSSLNYSHNKSTFLQ